MFFRLKTKLYFFKRKKILILLIILLMAVFIILGFIIRYKKTVQPPAEKTIAKTDNTFKKVPEPAILGSDIKLKYKEVKGTDFAILVTTMDLLEGASKKENKEHYRYIMEDNNNNQISLLRDTEGNYRDAVFINYNRLLKDIVVTKDISGGYIAPYGFTDKDETKFNKYSESKSIAIDDKTVFLDYPIYDGNYNQIGIMYIESN